MKKSIVNNIGLKLISVLIAFFIWLLVVQDNDPEKTKSIQNVPVTVLHAESVDEIGKVFKVEGSDQVTMYVTGRNSVVSKLNSSDFKLVADLEQINEMKTVPITISENNSSVRRENIRIEPASLKISIEDKVEQPFPIKVTTEGDTASGFEFGTATVRQGDSIIIAGPKSLVNIIEKVNVPIGIGGLSESTTLSGKIKITDKNGSEFNDTQMKNLEFKTSSGVLLAKSELDINVDIWKVQSNVKLDATITGEPAPGYRRTTVMINPETISLAGTPSALKELDNKLTLKDPISIEGAESDVTQKVELEDTLLENSNLKVENNTATTITVTIGIEKVGNKTISFPITRMTVKNQPEDLKMTLTPTDKLPITVYAISTDIDSLNEDDIKVILDMSSHKSIGTYTVPLKVELPEGFVLASEVTIVVNLDKKEDIEKISESTAEE